MCHVKLIASLVGVQRLTWTAVLTLPKLAGTVAGSVQNIEGKNVPFPSGWMRKNPNHTFGHQAAKLQ